MGRFGDVSTFLGLTDTPDSYTGKKFQTLIVNEDADEATLMDKSWISPIKGDGGDLEEIIEAYFGERPIFIPWSATPYLVNKVSIPYTTAGTLKGCGGDVTLGKGSVIKLNNGVDDRVLDFAEPGGGLYHRGHVLEDFYIDGNKANQSGGDYVVYLPKWVRGVLRNVGVYNGYDEGIRLTGLATITAYHNQLIGCKIYDCNGEGLHTVLTDENWITDLTTQSNGGPGIFITNGNIIKGHVSVNDYQAAIFSASGIIYSDFILDTMDREGILIQTQGGQIISNGHIHRASDSANNTYDGIRGVNVDKVTLDKIQFGDAGGNIVKYHIESQGSSDWWALDRMNYIGAAGTGDRLLVGANNTVDLEWT